jgi:uncharacterized membrane-anchored protein YitT (DUF2179 family)
MDKFSLLVGAKSDHVRSMLLMKYFYRDMIRLQFLCNYCIILTIFFFFLKKTYWSYTIVVQ